MAICAYCKTNDTERYENDSPICLNCLACRTEDRGGIQATLVEALAQATLRADSACTEFTAISSEIPGTTQGVQRIHNASRKLTEARDEMIRAHNRLDDFLFRGIVPEDLANDGA